ncbi:MAG: F0F1 ATP synthase subunit alpha [Clostridia bacterium]
MSVRIDEVSAILRQQLERYQVEIDVDNVGTVIEVADGVAVVHGLGDAMAGELLQFSTGVYGIAFNLESDAVGVVILGPFADIKSGDEVRTTGRIVEAPAGEEMLGRVVNSLGVPIDGEGPIETSHSRPVEIKAPGVIYRQSVDTPLQTGWKAIDALIPIGRGQRELIIGDRQTGKTALVIDTIINQRDSDVICIYVAIGQKASTVAGVVDTLKRHGAMDNTVVVSATASQPAPQLYIAPYTGCAIGEYFMYEENRDVLVIYDDLTKHSWAYREMSLLMRRPPGREAYPGDIFYLHSRLLERSAKLSEDMGGGSLTALPIVETHGGDISAYIPTNLISITDGQIFLEADLFYAGVRPAVDVGRSVSRVGSAAQVSAMKRVAGRLRLDLSQYRELEAFAQFGSDLDRATQARLARGERVTEVLKQKEREPQPVDDQILAIYLAVNGWLDKVEVEKIADYVDEFIAYVREEETEILEELRDGWKISDELAGRLDEAIERFAERVSAGAEEEAISSS